MLFLADESCDFAVVRALRGAGHDVAAVTETRSGASDEEVVQLALDEQRVLLTEDRDFGQLVFASSVSPPGVIYIRFPAVARGAMAADVLQVVDRYGNALVGRFLVVQPGRVRVTGI
jgi:predicted nuclease of predicted toxin-antitoxin system